MNYKNIDKIDLNIDRKVSENKINNDLNELKSSVNYAMNFIDKPNDSLNLSITKQDKDFFLWNIWKNRIYVTINWVEYWDFKWDSKQSKYILQDHREWKIPLEIKKWKKYTITISEKIIKHNYKEYLKKELEQEDIKELYKAFTQKETDIENKKEQILAHIEDIIKENSLDIQNGEYIYYIDKKLQRWFLIIKKLWKLKVIWYQKVSTWNPKRKQKRHFETPNLIIDRTEKFHWKKKLYEWDWRSIWTDRKWYWERWSKIFNLGEFYIDEKWNAHKLIITGNDWKWYFINSNWKKIYAYINLHFAMHKTTPWATTQLWKKMSQWCIRSSPFTIDLLDSQKLFNWKKWKYIIIWEYK